MRGKFYRADTEWVMPVYLEGDAEKQISQWANVWYIDLQRVVNQWLGANIKRLGSTK